MRLEPKNPNSPLTCPPILALPDWDEPFRLHKDANKISAAGAALIQLITKMEKMLAYASHWWTVTKPKKAATEPKYLAVLWTIDMFASNV